MRSLEESDSERQKVEGWVSGAGELMFNIGDREVQFQMERVWRWTVGFFTQQWECTEYC